MANVTRSWGRTVACCGRMALHKPSGKQVCCPLPWRQSRGGEEVGSGAGLRAAARRSLPVHRAVVTAHPATDMQRVVQLPQQPDVCYGTSAAGRSQLPRANETGTGEEAGRDERDKDQPGKGTENGVIIE